MKFEVLSHATLYVEHQGKSVLIDPWLRGSAYWRSWWNFPPVDQARAAALRPDFIYLTHIHWDHFHGPSLRAFDRDTPILIAYDRYDRMARDLVALGFANVIEIAHAQTYTLGEDFSLTPYLFSPFGDTAVVVSSASSTLLNANDCKIVGLPLKQLLDRHPQIDFAFRSHSSANSRVLYETIGQANSHTDHREDYMLAFANFMAAVKPRYAIPFASNHCHLHRETFHYNQWIVTTPEVATYYAKYQQAYALASALVIMLPGSTWDESEGFGIADQVLFENRDAALSSMLAMHDATLQETYRREALITLRPEEITAYFSTVFQHANWFVRRLFRGGPIVIRAFSGATASYWRVDVWHRTVSVSTVEEYASADARIEVPAMVLKHAMRANMFGHVSISKRVKYQATPQGMQRLKRFELLLCFEEAEMIPLTRALRWRVWKSYLPRWRELVLYVQVAFMRFARGISFQQIEQQLLHQERDRRA